MKYPISAVILTKNEEDTIERCLISLAFCSNILIIDDFSADRTPSLGRRHKARVIQHALQGDFANQRNFGLDQVTDDWILYVDADEVVTPELKKDIIDVVTNKKEDAQAYYIKRRDFWWGTELKHGETRKVRNKGIIRLVRRNAGVWMGNVHEVFHTAKKTATLHSFLNHHPHPGIQAFIRDVNEYSSLRAKELMVHGERTNIFQIVCFPLGKFILNYVCYFGFLDGVQGFAYAFCMSFHSFLVRAKLYQYYLIR